MAGLIDSKMGNKRPESSPDSTNARNDEALAGQSSHERSQSVTDVFNLEGLTLYEKKCVLVNREIDSMGMGKYQWCLWALCGESELYHTRGWE